MKKQFKYLLALSLMIASVIPSAPSRAEPSGVSVPVRLTVQPLASPLLTLSDFERASVTHRNERTVLALTLKPGGAARLRRYSASHVGEPLAIVLGGETISAPRLRTAIIGNHFEVDSLTDEQAHAVAALVTGVNRDGDARP